MASPTLSDFELAKKYGRRRGGNAVFEPGEFGYHCPEGHSGYSLTWSEFKEHIWCYRCKLDYPSECCPLQRPSWMKREDFNTFIAKLPFKPIIMKGVDHSLDEVEQRTFKANEQQVS